MKKTTILIVDDEKLNIELAGVYLKEEGYRVLYALSGAKAMEMLHSNKVDLVLLDINMPKMDGFTVCQKIKDDSNFADLPVVFLTALGDIESITRGFEVGGVDYIIKPFNPLELKARVKTHIQTLKLLKELKNKQNKLAQLSIQDQFTKLPNVLYFESQLSIALKEEKAWVMFLKIDKLEALNRLYGFARTNKILALFAKLLRKNSFSNAKIARIYGGSFGIIFKDYKFNQIEKNLVQIRKALREDPTLKGVLTVDVVLYHAAEKTSIDMVYAKMQEGLEKIKHSLDFNYILLN